MIQVTKLTGEQFFVNADQIEVIEGTPDTVITLNSGRKYVVQEPLGEVLEQVRAFHGLGPPPPRSKSLRIVSRIQPPKPEEGATL